MAGWNPVANGADIADWHAAAKMVQYVNAIEERLDALGGASTTGLPTTTAGLVGYDCQGITLNVASVIGWATLQAYIDFTLLLGGWANTSSPPDLLTSEDMFTQAIGGGATSWRRYTTLGGGVAYGRMQAGDIIGPWIFEDLQNCLNEIVWHRATGTWQAVFEGREEGTKSEDTWNEAKTGAEGDVHLHNSAGSPYAWTIGATGGEKFTATFDGQKMPYQITGIPQFANHTMAYYVKATAAWPGFDEAFDDYTSGMAENVWYKWDEPAANDNDATETSADLGVDNLGTLLAGGETWCADPTGGITARGWVVDDVVALVKWDVANGFVYY